MTSLNKEAKQSIQSDFKIVLVGAGNVATRIGLYLHGKGKRIEGVCSRSESAGILAEKLGCRHFTSVKDIPTDVDMVLISTTDASVAEVAKQLPLIKGFVAHTSGSIPLEALTAYHKHAAVLYPLQTFSKDVAVDISRVPFFIEASDHETLEAVRKVALMLSQVVKEADSFVRSRLHIAGVLSSNFPIYLLEMTKRVLQDVDLPLDTVAPLVEATIAKAFAVGPESAMTGPARRGDIAVIKKQMSAIGNDNDREIYELISKAILKEFHPETEL